MRKKKKMFNYFKPQKALFAIVIFGCLVPFTFAEGETKPSGFEDAAIDPIAQPNTEAHSEIQEGTADPASTVQLDKGFVKITEQDAEEFVTSGREKKTDVSFAVLESLIEIDEISDINNHVFEMDPIFNEIIEPSLGITKDKDGDGVYGPLEYPSIAGETNITSAHLKSKLPYISHNTVEGFEEWERDKRGALHLAGIIKCATNCNPLTYKGYGCFCGFMGAGNPVDPVDMCCKMHDWCYTTSDCHGLEWDLPYFVPFKWKCNGGAPYCIPGKTKRTNRNSCSHQLCECDREFAMCLNKYLPCPKAKATCIVGGANRFLDNLFSVFTSGSGKKPSHHSSSNKHTNIPHGHRHHHNRQSSFSSTPRKPKNSFDPFKIFG